MNNKKTAENPHGRNENAEQAASEFMLRKLLFLQLRIRKIYRKFLIL